MKRFRGIILMVLLIAVWLTAEALMYRRTVPPASVTDFPTFAKWQQSPRDIEVIQQGGTGYLLATGPGGGLLASGPSSYVFDRSGRLVDWSSDIGDDPRFRDKWIPSPQRSGPHLDVDGALRWINAGGTAAG
jgi:hypothetical protein